MNSPENATQSTLRTVGAALKRRAVHDGDAHAVRNPFGCAVAATTANDLAFDLGLDLDEVSDAILDLIAVGWMTETKPSVDGTPRFELAEYAMGPA